MERRNFFYLAGLGSATILAGNFLASCSKDDDNADETGTPPGSDITINLADSNYSSLATPGNSLIKDNLIIIHTTGDTYIALSKVCTHQSCTVGFDGTNVVCPCHGSKFSTSGSVLNGPANAPLAKYSTSLQGNILTISV